MQLTGHQPALLRLHLTLSPEEVLQKLAAETDQERVLTTPPFQERKPFVARIRGERFRFRPYRLAARRWRIFTHFTTLHGSVHRVDAATLLEGVFIVPSYADLSMLLLLVGAGWLGSLFVRLLSDSGWAATVLVGGVLALCIGLLVSYLLSIRAARKRAAEEQQRMRSFLEALFREHRVDEAGQRSDDSAL